MFNQIAADLFAEGLITLTQATRLKGLPLRRQGKPIHVSTFIRWAKDGVGPTKTKLETVRVGGTLCTSIPAIGRFFARCANPDAPATARTPTQRSKSIEKAEAALAASGI